MLARSDRLPTRTDYAFEVKWDGFRALVRTDGEFHVRSRRGWNMTPLVPEFADLPARGLASRAACARRHEMTLLL